LARSANYVKLTFVTVQIELNQITFYLLKTRQHIWQVLKTVDELDQQGSEEHLQ